ncbi:MAG: glycoside hydrolase family 57 protein [Hyphomicrobiales bacterium]
MKSVCFYFQVHQPYRLRTYRFFDIGSHSCYFDDFNNSVILKRVAEKCYLPMNKVLLDLIHEYGENFKVSFSISGIAIDQFEQYAPEVLKSFQDLADTGSVEFLCETYGHSLSSLVSPDEFRNQVYKHKNKIKDIFGIEPKTFRNTELVYSNEIGAMVAELGFKTMLTEGAKHVLGWKSPNYLYCNVINPKLKLLLKNFRLSDDIAFRFGLQAWPEWPLTADKFADWISMASSDQEVINLFMDYETFGEHQWEATGIFDFMRSLPSKVFEKTDFQFNFPSEVAEHLQPVGAMDVPYPVSWADEERDLTAWLGNELQNEAFDKLYQLEEKVNHCVDQEIIDDWIRLQTSDHFYYMCTKWFSDGDVHKYFNHYNSPYEAFINYMNVLADFNIRIDKHLKDKNIDPDPLDNETTISQKRKARHYIKDFKDLDQLPDKTIRSLLTMVDMGTLINALGDDYDHVKDRIIQNMSSEERKHFLNISQYSSENLSLEKKESIRAQLLEIVSELS